LEELQGYVASRVLQVKAEDADKTSKTRIRSTTYTHTELNDVQISIGIQALVGCFFSQNGPDATYCLLKWLGFDVPDADGASIPLGTQFNYHSKYSSEPEEDYAVTVAEVHKLLPNAEELEAFLGYK